MNSWRPGSVFDWLAATGRIAIDEMRRTFNCGVGMVVVVDSTDVDAAIEVLRECGESAWRIGTIVEGAGAVDYI